MQQTAFHAPLASWDCSSDLWPWCYQCDYRYCYCLHGFYSSRCNIWSGSYEQNWSGCLPRDGYGGCLATHRKAQFLVTRTEDIAETIAKAYYIAATGRPGPVVVDIPKDVTDPDYKVPYEWPKNIKMRSYQPTNKGHRGQVKRAVKTLLEAKRPVIYTGGGIILDNAAEYLTQLTQKLNYPITNTLMGLGWVSSD